MKQITSLEDLINTIKSGKEDFFINGGIWRSSKTITYDNEKFYVFNEIDGTEQELTPEQLFDEEYTNIGKCINIGRFYAY